MRSRLVHYILCLMLVLQGLPMMPVAQAHAPCPVMATHVATPSYAAMTMHAATAMPCDYRMPGSMGSGMHAAAAHGHDRMTNCGSPCQANVPAALMPVAILATLHLPAILASDPRPLQYGICEDSIQRPPIA